MSSCPGLHCNGCGNGNGPGIGVLAVILISAIVLGAISRSMHTIDHMVSDVITVLTIACFTMVGIAVTSVTGVITYKIVKARRIRLESIALQNKENSAIENNRRAITYIPSESIVVRRTK